MPALRFREWTLVQVTIKSPTPDRPLKVSGRAPQATPSRAISVRPRVIKAALVLSPKPKPSAIPTAKAMTFFKAPPSSTPMTSSLT